MQQVASNLSSTIFHNWRSQNHLNQTLIYCIRTCSARQYDLYDCIKYFTFTFRPQTIHHHRDKIALSRQRNFSKQSSSVTFSICLQEMCFCMCWLHQRWPCAVLINGRYLDDLSLRPSCNLHKTPATEKRLGGQIGILRGFCYLLCELSFTETAVVQLIRCTLVILLSLVVNIGCQFCAYVTYDCINLDGSVTIIFIITSKSIYKFIQQTVENAN